MIQVVAALMTEESSVLVSPGFHMRHVPPTFAPCKEVNKGQLRISECESPNSEQNHNHHDHDHDNDYSTKRRHQGDANGVHRCGVEDLTEEQFQEAERARHERLSTITSLVSSYNINVYVHVITDTKGNGKPPQSQIDDQIAVLNAAYNSAGWKFILQTVDFTANDVWYVVQPNTQAEKEMKNALRIGGADSLNLYTANIGGGLLGWATFPKDYTKSPKMDGVVILCSSLPGGTSANVSVCTVMCFCNRHRLVQYDEGDTGTHEGGCQGSGDGVDDTPAEMQANYGCPGVVDSCPLQPGNDPTNNFMDYVYDSCMNEFTPGQFNKIQQEFSAYRV
ncbi:unnamed protein product, partial [Sphagnum jensenii]